VTAGSSKKSCSIQICHRRPGSAHPQGRRRLRSQVANRRYRRVVNALLGVILNTVPQLRHEPGSPPPSVVP
jgi:hypothetical protein